jgi:hypothetical protein
MTDFNRIDENQLNDLHRLGEKSLNRSIWTEQDHAKCFELITALSGSQYVDTGCSACRNNAVNMLRGYYEEYTKNNAG